MTGASFLQRMAAASRQRARAARERVPEGALERRAHAAPPAPPLTLGSFDVIAELKLRSPAAGALAAGGFDRFTQLEAYAAGGAAAVSVLTEPNEFHGELAHLEEAAERLAKPGCPAMRKDFLTDPYQVLEARAAGAGGVLVIVAMLDDGPLRELVTSARELGMFALLEAFDRADLDRIAALGAADGMLAGVNCRDLKDLSVDFGRFEALAAHLPPGLPAVAESGIANAGDIRTVAAAGYRLALVGSALMRSGDPAATLTEFVTAGRDERARAVLEQPA